MPSVGEAPRFHAQQPLAERSRDVLQPVQHIIPFGGGGKLCPKDSHPRMQQYSLYFGYFRVSGKR
ncbi:hypothetical protein WT15_08055 [Burkholderia stagnalis]|nr:hypothetical protein WT74_21615 [Burkholderia stagnalis]KVN82588.1 hypothetical protein WT15_08055 [Burkholderia stagnalis]KWO35744.1 hypothetical protein WT96_16700 [Burkholderia stagnalis]KWO36889.1 hypothetical protein WT95_08095 [Burkholderia stagnalis]